MQNSSYHECYKMLCEQLGSRFEADQLFMHITGKKPYDISDLTKVMPAGQTARLLALCSRRRTGEPLQYLLGEWEFYGLPFLVGPGVLIPRADTELLVDTALECMDKLPAPEILDLCSGSGCIAIALAHHRRDARVTALELSAQAFVYLQQNIAQNQVNVAAVRMDLRQYHHPKPVDILTANPPYIAAHELLGLQAEVLHEPKAALDGGEDGLYFYREIAARYISQLSKGGWICLEIGVNQHDAVAELLMGQGFRNIQLRKDICGVQRVVLAQK